jgi:hypothetical protein
MKNNYPVLLYMKWERSSLQFAGSCRWCGEGSVICSICCDGFTTVLVHVVSNVLGQVNKVGGRAVSDNID